MNPQDLQPALDTLPAGSTVATVGLVAVMVLGGLLWLLGRQLAKPACAISGLVLGGLAGLAVGEAWADQGAFVIPLVIGASVAGALLASLMFRVWVAISGAALLALAAPAVVLIWQGTPAPPSEAPTAALQQPIDAPPGPLDWLLDPLRQAGDASVVEATATAAPNKAPDRSPDADASEEDSTTREELGRMVNAATEAARTWYDEQVERVRLWWEEMGPIGRRRLYTAAAVGALVGLVFGLAMPTTAASLESALVGAILLLLPAGKLLSVHAPNQAAYLPQTPRGTLLWLGLITLLGFLVQWTLFRKRADK